MTTILPTLAILSTIISATSNHAPYVPGNEPAPASFSLQERASEQDFTDAAAKPVDIPARSALPAIAKPHRHATVSAPISRPIQTIHVRAGDRVEQGDVIVSFNDRVANAAASAARARADARGTLETAGADLRFALAKEQRLRDARIAGSAGALELLQAEAAAERARAALEHAREQARIARLEADRAQAELQEHTVTAPFSGVITRIHTEVGETPGPTQPLFEIAAIDQLTIDLHLPASVAITLTPGDSYNVYAQDPINTKLAAYLSAVIPAIDPAARTMRCVLLVDNPGEVLPAGFHIATRPADPTEHAGALTYHQSWQPTQTISPEPTPTTP